MALHLFSPAVTLIIYAIQAQIRGAKAVDVNMAFTSLPIIDIVCTPANTLLAHLPQAASVVAAFDRIQAYLLSPDRQDKRKSFDKGPENGVDGLLSDVAIHIDHATVRPALAADPVLRDISTVCKKGNLVVVSGAVGTGKTTFAKLLLGDLPPESGVVQTSFESIAYCSQTAWLMNGSIKEVICGPPGDESKPDEEWYKRVVYACALEEDFNHMADGDQTVIGSRGMTLSGGQKQRVVSIPGIREVSFSLTLPATQALARAVYARRSLVILDDVLSALDATTERRVVDRLIGPQGLFRELSTTVVLITHASKQWSTNSRPPSPRHRR